MSKKRDEMAEMMWVALNVIDRKPHAKTIYKEGWDAALLHDERVLALVEALEFYSKQEEWETFLFQIGFDLRKFMFTPENCPWKSAREALAKIGMG